MILIDWTYEYAWLSSSNSDIIIRYENDRFVHVQKLETEKNSKYTVLDQTDLKQPILVSSIIDMFFVGRDYFAIECD